MRYSDIQEEPRPICDGWPEIVNGILHKNLKGADQGFYSSDEWRLMRYRVLRESNGYCMCCGVSSKHAQLHVDHIKPRSKYPELELEFTNLQVLCLDCNLGKSNKFEDDWRPPQRKPKLNLGKLRSLIAKIG